MKYENIEQITKLVKQIKKDESELTSLASYKESEMRLIITTKSKTISTIGIGDFEHPYTKIATAFIEDCIQLLRDKITKSKQELEKL